jgi:spoIIIJ-associated protein
MDSEKAKKIIEQIFNLIGTPTESILYNLDEKKGHVFSIKSAEFERVSLDKEDLNRDTVYLLKRIFSKNTLPALLEQASSSTEENFKCTIDINNLQSKADDKIKIKALNAAEEAKKLKTDVVMEPMSSYERMVIHSTLAGLPDVSTESIGVGRERKVKVKYLAI